MRKLLEKQYPVLENQPKIDPFKYFFGHVINQITTLDAKDEFANNNFCMQHSASNIKAARRIEALLGDEFDIKTHCDVGCGVAVLSSMFLQKGIDSYAIEGLDYGIRNNMIKIPAKRYVVCDMTSGSVECLDMNKFFDLTTTIEINEHIPRDKIEVFYENLKYMSRHNFCSLHYDGDENSEEFPNHNHYNVSSVEWWEDFLSKFGKVTIYEDFQLSNFGESVFARVDFDD